VTGTARATMVCLCVLLGVTIELSPGIMRMERLLMLNLRSICLHKVYTKSKSRTIKKKRKKKESERRKKKEEQRKTKEVEQRKMKEER